MGRKSKALKLTGADREDLRIYLSVGRRSARALKRAMMLKYMDEGVSTERIVSLLDTSRPTVGQVKRRCLNAGLQAALCEKPRSGQPKKVDEQAEAHVTTLACSSPPEGRKSWTVRLIQDKVIELGYVETISRESVRKILKKAY